MRTAISASVAILLIVIAAVFIRFKILDNDDEPALAKAAQASEKTGELFLETVSEVPDQLKEISGIAYLDDQRFACIQDEEGSVFIYHIGDKKIEKKIPFGPNGDYEDLALVGSTLYVLRADGRLFSIKDFSAPKPIVREHATGLTGYDFEGLCYDQAQNRLLLAVKEAKGSQESQATPVYEFDLGTLQAKPDPVFTIDLAGIELSSEGKKSNPLKPSAIGIHPVSKEIYLLEGAKPRMVILDKAGKPLQVRKLKGKHFIQPEGLAFSPQGKMFIGNEGSKKRAGNIISARF